MAPPKTTFISVPSKKTDSVSFTEPLAKYIADQYGQDPGDYSSAISELSSLRENSLVKAPEIHESGVNAIARYYGLFCSMASRFPLADGEVWDSTMPNPIKIKFTWSNLYETKGFFSKSKTKKALENANFEKVNVLFNLGALQSQVAASQNMSSDSGLKAAVKFFQAAATTFLALSNMTMSMFASAPSSDLHPSFLKALSDLNLAQAQETLWVKCVSERKSASTILQLAAQTADLYQAALQAILSVVEADKSWIDTLRAKAAFFTAEAHYRAGQDARDAGKYGVGVAHFRVAAKEITEAERIGEPVKLQFQTKSGHVKEALDKLENENHKIYHELVPDPNILDDLPKLAVAKADDKLPDYTSADFLGSDPFVEIVPVAVHQASQRYFAKRDQLISEKITALRQCTQDNVEALLSMNLPAALQVSESPNTVPEAILKNRQAIIEGGGVEFIESKIQNLPGLNKTCQDMLDDVREQLEDEVRSDKEMRDKFGSRWSVEPSEKLTKQTLTDFEKYQSAVSQAKASDETVVERYNDMKPALLLMTKSPEEIAQSLPTGSGNGQQSPASEEVKRLLYKMDELRATRDGLEATLDELKENDSITARLLDAGASTPEDTVFDGQLARYGDAFAKADAIIQETQQATEELRAANEAFVASRGKGNSEREQMLNDLQKKFEAWKDLRMNLIEGEKFYAHLAGLLDKLQSKVKDFVFARDVEKKEMRSEISRTIATTPSEHPPDVSSLNINPQASRGPSSAQPPARPPPPATSSAQAGSSASQRPGFAPFQAMPPAAGPYAPSAPYAGPSLGPYARYAAYGQPQQSHQQQPPNPYYQQQAPQQSYYQSPYGQPQYPPGQPPYPGQQSYPYGQQRY